MIIKKTILYILIVIIAIGTGIYMWSYRFQNTHRSSQPQVAGASTSDMSQNNENMDSNTNKSLISPLASDSTENKPTPTLSLLPTPTQDSISNQQQTTPPITQFVGIYLSATLDSDAEPVTRSLTVNPNGTTSLTTNANQQKTVEYGTWNTDQPNRIVINLTGEGAKVYEPPKMIIFELVNDILTAIKYNENMYDANELKFIKQ